MKFFKILIPILLLFNSAYSQDLVAEIEAETGTMTGVGIAEQSSGSSQKYVTGFDAAGDKLSITVNIPEAKLYKLIIRYRSAYGVKVQDLYANDAFVANVSFPQNTTFEDLDAGTIPLIEGSNTITIKNSWGYVDLDKFSIYTLLPNQYKITEALIDPKATNETKALYTFLKSNFGKNIISGQTDSRYDEVKTATGKSPMLRAFDLLTYCPQYPYDWKNGGHAFGPVPDNSPENAIAWYNATGKKGIVSFHWHWYSPSGGKVGTNTFSTENTTFDIRQAVISGTQENKDAIRDIDAIAVQLKKISDAGIPVIWRPLHEAGGAWFWWGAKGSAACKALWDMVYDRLTNYHALHNMIWLWSSPEADWYPGNAKVDMIGYDSYPGDFNYSSQKNIFDKLFGITSGEKLIAMSENGPVPDIQSCLNSDAPWSYFMSWSDLVFSQNSTQHLTETFANPNVLTLENPVGSILTGTETLNTSLIFGFPNPFQGKFTISAKGFFDYTLYNQSGFIVEKGRGENSADVADRLQKGFYILKIRKNGSLQTLKLVKQ